MYLCSCTFSGGEGLSVWQGSWFDQGFRFHKVFCQTILPVRQGVLFDDLHQLDDLHQSSDFEMAWPGLASLSI